MLEIVSFTLGPALTNAYLIADAESGEAAVIDPAWDGHLILEEAVRRSWRISHIWLTHAHFDHLGGAAAIADGLNPPPFVALHPEDHELWRIGGGAKMFGFNIDPGPEPTINLEQKQILTLGEYKFEVLFAPGHTPGHVMFYCSEERILFCGDVIFQFSIGRTDLPGGDYQTLIDSINREVLTLSDETRLLTGHGEMTTVGNERLYNPFIN